MFEVLLSFQRAFNNDITWLRDTGVLQKLKLDSFRPPFPIPDPKVRHDLPLTIYQLGIVVIVLTIGLIFSIDTFLFVVNIHRHGIHEANKHLLFGGMAF